MHLRATTLVLQRRLNRMQLGSCIDAGNLFIAFTRGVHEAVSATLPPSTEGFGYLYILCATPNLLQEYLGGVPTHVIADQRQRVSLESL